MRLGDLKVELAFVIPFGRLDKNDVVYSKGAVEKAIDSFNKSLPIIFRDIDVNKDGTVLGITAGETNSVIWDEERCICEVIVNGYMYYGGVECIVNETKDGVVTDFDIVSIGLSKKENNYEKDHNQMENISACDTCTHADVCRFEVPVGEDCNYYVKS